MPSEDLEYRIQIVWNNLILLVWSLTALGLHPLSLSETEQFGHTAQLLLWGST